MSQNWFKPVTRGIFIISFSTSTVIIRILQIGFYKYKLASIASKKQMVIEKRKLRNLRRKNIQASIELGQSNFSGISRIPVSSHHNHQSQIKHQKYESHNLNSMNNDDNNYTNTDNSRNNIEYNKSTNTNNNLQTNTTNHEKENEEIKKKEDIASDLMNYNFALYFISFSTFSDASFDIIQGIVLILGYTTTTHPLAVIGSMVGFGTEVIDFFEEIFGFALAICREFDAVLAGCGDILENIWCISVSVGCMIEQAIAVYVIYFVFDCVQFLCAEQLLLLVILSLCVSVIGFIIGAVFLVYACLHRRVRISLDLSILKKDSDVNKELEKEKQEDKKEEIKEEIERQFSHLTLQNEISADDEQKYQMMNNTATNKMDPQSLQYQMYQQQLFYQQQFMQRMMTNPQ
eukprot:438661_1